MLDSIVRRYPVTILFTLLALTTAAFPALTTLFELDFTKVAGGEWWRLVSGHWTHFGASHLFWDLSMFAGLSAACEHRHRRGFFAAMITSLLFISAVIACACPSITTYRGLSGIDTGLFVWFVIDQFRASLREGEMRLAAIAATAVIGLFGKLIYEAVSGATLFVDSSSFVPLVESHLAGAACGLILGVAPMVKNVCDVACSPDPTCLDADLPIGAAE